MKKFLGLIALFCLFYYSSDAKDVKELPSHLTEMTIEENQFIEEYKYDYDYYMIYEGDTWYQLGKLFNVDCLLLQKFHYEMTGKFELRAGESIIIPAGIILAFANMNHDFVQGRVDEAWEMIYQDAKDEMPKD